MTERQDTAPPMPEGADTEKPSSSRVYDWYLGGTRNWAVDREFGKQALAIFPQARELARQNRKFMNRAVRAALAAGIKQFLDLGSGVPTSGNVHEIVRAGLSRGKSASVVYVDYEPVAATHATMLIDRQRVSNWVGLVQEDLRSATAVLRHPTTRRLIDFRRPVCLLMTAVLHFVGDGDQPGEIVRAYQERLVGGSWLVISHLGSGEAPEDATTAAQRFAGSYQNTSNPLWLRSAAEIRPWFGDWPLLEPGLVHMADWRPDGNDKVDASATPFGWGGVAKKG
jgi:S-adenosyl methyltransferase